MVRYENGLRVKCRNKVGVIVSFTRGNRFYKIKTDDGLTLACVSHSEIDVIQS